MSDGLIVVQGSKHEYGLALGPIILDEMKLGFLDYFPASAREKIQIYMNENQLDSLAGVDPKVFTALLNAEEMDFVTRKQLKRVTDLLITCVIEVDGEVIRPSHYFRINHIPKEDIDLIEERVNDAIAEFNGASDLVGE